MAKGNVQKAAAPGKFRGTTRQAATVLAATAAFSALLLSLAYLSQVSSLADVVCVFYRPFPSVTFKEVLDKHLHEHERGKEQGGGEGDALTNALRLQERDCVAHREVQFDPQAVTAARASQRAFSKLQWRAISDYLDRLPFHKWADTAFHPREEHKYDVLGPPALQCLHPELYSSGDEERHACGLSRLPTCVVLSVGSNNQWEFEEAIAAQTNCTIHTYDCTLSSEPQIPPSIAHRVHFHPWCLGSHDSIKNGRQFYSFASLLRQSNLTQVPHYVKMDIEGDEYEVIFSMIETQLQPLQLTFEFHAQNSYEVAGHKAHRYREMAEIALFGNYLWERGGYYLLHSRPNPHTLTCVEVMFAKLDCRATTP
eukprot:g66177.t1